MPKESAVCPSALSHFPSRKRGVSWRRSWRMFCAIRGMLRFFNSFASGDSHLLKLGRFDKQIDICFDFGYFDKCFEIAKITDWKRSLQIINPIKCNCLSELFRPCARIILFYSPPWDLASFQTDRITYTEHARRKTVTAHDLGGYWLPWGMFSAWQERVFFFLEVQFNSNPPYLKYIVILGGGYVTPPSRPSMFINSSWWFHFVKKYVHPENWGRWKPNFDEHYFSDGLKPPTKKSKWQVVGWTGVCRCLAWGHGHCLCSETPGTHHLRIWGMIPGPSILVGLCVFRGKILLEKASFWLKGSLL